MSTPRSTASDGRVTPVPILAILVAMLVLIALVSALRPAERTTLSAGVVGLPGDAISGDTPEDGSTSPATRKPRRR